MIKMCFWCNGLDSCAFGVASLQVPPAAAHVCATCLKALRRLVAVPQGSGCSETVYCTLGNGSELSWMRLQEFCLYLVPPPAQLSTIMYCSCKQSVVIPYRRGSCNVGSLIVRR